MTDKSISSTVTFGFFVVWFAILLAGADFPPPIGFLWVTLFDLIAAGLVYVRIPTYLNWQDNHKKGSLLCVLFDGLAIGFLFALIVIWLPGSGEPSLPPSSSLIPYFIWFTVLSIVGAINSGVVYGVIYCLRKFKRT